MLYRLSKILSSLAEAGCIDSSPQATIHNPALFQTSMSVSPHRARGLEQPAETQREGLPVTVRKGMMEMASVNA